MHPTVPQYKGEQAFDPLANLIDAVLRYGDKVPDRTGTGTLELFGASLHYNMAGGDFPLCVLKKTSFRNIAVELLWLLRGEPHLEFMHKHDVHHWDPWIPKDERFGPGGLGRVYGVQWRDWTTLGEEIDDGANYREPTYKLEAFDQIKALVDGIRKDPHGRRHLVTCWNPGELDQMALPPCHLLFQCHVSSERVLSLQVYQRSADLFIGVPYDVGMYALLLRMLCEVLDLSPGMLVFTFGSAHVYLNHLEQAREMIGREHRPFPRLTMALPGRPADLDSFTLDQFTLEGYNPHPFIKAPVAV